MARSTPSRPPDPDGEPVVPPAVRRLSTFLQDTGPYLRRVVYYDADRATHVYVRDDLRDELSADALERLVTDVRIDAFAQSQQERVYANGRLHCFIRSFEEAFELNLILTETEGVAISFDPEAFSRLFGFIDRYAEILAGD